MTEETKTHNNTDTIENRPRKSQNGVLYNNNNDITKLIRVSINDWKAFSTLSLFENTTRLELFGKVLNHYVENTKNLSEEQRSLILKELQKESADNE